MSPFDVTRTPARGRHRRRPAHRRPRGPDRHARRRCRPSGSTTRAAASCSRRSPAARVLPDAGRARDPRRPGRRDRRGDRRAHPRRAGLRARRRRPGTCSTRCPDLHDVRAGRRQRERAARRPGEALIAERPGLDVHALIADFTGGLALPRHARSAAGRLPRRHDRQPAARRARRVPAPRVRALLSPGDALLLGTDLVKDESVLVAGLRRRAGRDGRVQQERADRAQPRARRRLRPRRLRAPVACGTPSSEWIEMRLRARRALTVKIPALDLAVDFAAGEEMRTEVSAKFREERRTRRAGRRRSRPHALVDGRRGRFALSLSTAR